MSDPGVLTRIMELADEYARAVADTPHCPSRLERMLATERIERARDTLTAYAAQVTVGYVLVPKYKTAMGLAAEKYLYSVNRFAHPLPQQFLWEKCFEMMIAAAQETVSYVLVPLEPTAAMLAAGVAAESNAATHVQERLTLYAYRAMIAAAQEQKP